MKGQIGTIWQLLPIIFHDCEGWSLAKTSEENLIIFESTVLGKILGSIYGAGVWRIRKNGELRESDLLQ